MVARIQRSAHYSESTFAARILKPKSITKLDRIAVCAQFTAPRG